MCVTSSSSILPRLFIFRGRRKGTDRLPGYQHVCRLARALVGVRNRQRLSDRRVDGLVALWLALPDLDKQRLIYPARHQERIVQGRFKATKGKSSIVLGKDSLQWYVVSVHVVHLTIILPASTLNAYEFQAMAIIIFLMFSNYLSPLFLFLPSRTQLGPCKLAGHQPFGGGHLQSALSNPSQRHAVCRCQEEQVGTHSGRLHGHQGGSAEQPEVDGPDQPSAL